MCERRRKLIIHANFWLQHSPLVLVLFRFHADHALELFLVVHLDHLLPIPLFQFPPAPPKKVPQVRMHQKRWVQHSLLVLVLFPFQADLAVIHTLVR